MEKYATAQSSFLYSFSMMMGGFEITGIAQPRTHAHTHTRARARTLN